MRSYEDGSIEDVFKPMIQKFGLRLEFPKERGWHARLEGEGLFIRIFFVDNVIERILDVGFSARKGDALRAYSEGFWNVVDEQDWMSFREVLRGFGHSIWTYRKLQFRIYTKRLHGPEMLVVLRDAIEQYCFDPLQGNLGVLFALLEKRILVPVYYRVQKASEQLASKYSLTVSYLASANDWRIIVANEQINLIVKISVSRDSKASVAFGSNEGGQFKHFKHLWQLAAHRAAGEEYSRHLGDLRKTRWRVDTVSDKLDRLLVMLDKYAADILSGEVAIESATWLPEPTYGLR